MARTLCVLTFLVIFGSACNTDTPPDEANHSVRVGADVLQQRSFDVLSGSRIGLIANQTTVVGDRHLVDVLLDSEAVELVSVFAPEHGFRGEVEAGLKVATDTVAASIPVYSLYGDTRAPTAEMLANVDILIFDIQDIGARFYTYISTLGLAMQAAAENDVEFLVLDRPNPLGGALIDGPILDDDVRSFVGMYPVPVVHGLTVGELALMIKGENYLDGLEDLSLTVVPVEGWSRTMQWPETGLRWIATSPNIPDFETALVYPGICLFEATRVNEGRGTYQPFKIFGAPDWDGAAIVKQLRGEGLAGVEFDTTSYTPKSIPSMSATPKHQDVDLIGIRISVTNREAIRPVEIGIHALAAVRDNWPDEKFGESLNARWMTLLYGSEDLRTDLINGKPATDIVRSWQSDLSEFEMKRKQYLLYD